MLEARYRPLTRYLIEAECTVSGGYAKTSKVPRDAHFAHLVGILVELYTRPLTDKELVLCVDEKTNLQPRPRLAPTLPTRSGSPTRLEHEYKRAGALHLFAAFDTRTGKVYARTERRKRQVEFLAFLSQLEQEIPVGLSVRS
jgi:DDE superfamily endonuclease